MFQIETLTCYVENNVFKRWKAQSGNSEQQMSTYQTVVGSSVNIVGKLIRQVTRSKSMRHVKILLAAHASSLTTRLLSHTQVKDQTGMPMVKRRLL